MNPLEVVWFALGTVTPIYLVTALGVVLRRLGMLSDDFLRDASRLVFNLGAPAMLFLSLAGADIELSRAPRFLVASAGLVMLLSLLAWPLAAVLVRERAQRGVFLQGAARGNLLIAGLAMAQSLYGREGVVLASLPMAVFIVFGNVFSILMLRRYGADLPGSGAGMAVLRNPVILGIVLGVLAGALELPLPGLLVETGNIVGQLTVPLVLFMLGASLDFRELRKPALVSWGAAFYKCLWMPAIGTALGYGLGLRGMELGILFLVLASPTASISVVFVEMFGGDRRLAANIVLVSGALSFLVNCAGLIALRWWGLI
ncbi:MAG: AEC family transporter [Pseudomonadota bacterium]